MGANFTPEQKEYKNLTPFKLCIIKNFPFIEEDFDALTNYQLLCKIVEYLNQVISNNQAVTENTQKLYNAFVSLQDYVNNYFNNLDVNQEVQNIIDKLVQDGTIKNLINDDLFKELNESININKENINRLEKELNESVNINRENINKLENEIESSSTKLKTELENQISKLANGSPIPVNSISEMTDTNKIYVLTTDGKWYYYNGTNWVAGGVYQSTQIGENQITSDNIENVEFNKVKNSILDINLDSFSQWNGKGNIIKNGDGSITYNKTSEGNGGISISNLKNKPNKDLFIILELNSNYESSKPIEVFRMKPSTQSFTRLKPGLNIIKIDKQYNTETQGIILTISTMNNFTINYLQVVEGDIEEIYANKSLSEIIKLLPNYFKYSDIKNYKNTKITDFASWSGVPFYNFIENNGVILKGKSSGNSGIQSPIYNNTKDFLYVKGDLQIPTNSQLIVFMAKADGSKYISQRTYTSNDTKMDLKIDLANLAVYEELTEYALLLVVNGGYPTNEVTISNFNMFWGNIEDMKIYADNLNDVIYNIQQELDDINLKIESGSSAGQYLVAPNGMKYKQAVTNEGELYAFPITPNKALYIGNSLLLGFGTHGMASYSVNDDYYHYVNQAILEKNYDYTSERINGTTFEGATEISVVQNWINDTLLQNLAEDINLIFIQLGDNCNTDEKISLLPTSAPLLIQTLKQRCPNARIYWVGTWYSTSLKNQYINQACVDNNIEFINISNLNNSANQAKIGDSYIDSEGETQEITSEGVASHPSSTGMLAIANRIIPYLEL